MKIHNILDVRSIRRSQSKTSGTSGRTRTGTRTGNRGRSAFLSNRRSASAKRGITTGILVAPIVCPQHAGKMCYQCKTTGCPPELQSGNQMGRKLNDRQGSQPNDRNEVAPPIYKTNRLTLQNESDKMQMPKKVKDNK